MSIPKKILILGGNAAQIPLIETAKGEGYFVVLADYTTTNPGIALADKHYQVDFQDKEAVLDIAVKENVQGVISNSEAAMPIVAYVAENRGLVGNSYESIVKISSKIDFRELQRRVGAYAPSHVVTETFEDALEKAHLLSFPIIIKPCKSSGSRGTKKISTYEELEQSYDDWFMCRRYAINKRVVLEEFVEMPSLDDIIDGDVFVCNGHILWNGLFTSKRSRKAPMIPMTQTYPIVLSEGRLCEVKKLISDIFAEAGIVHGEYNIELYYTSDERLFCIEINARQGGNGIPDMVRSHSGIDMYKLLVTTVMGDMEYFEKVISAEHECNFVSKHPVYSHVDGVLNGLFVSDEISTFITDTKILKKNGDLVRAVQMAGDMIALIELKFESREQQLSFTDKIEEHIYPVVSEGQNDC
ncbi:MAG: ATP-grasp domain-containing protein [Clostridia bacterium]|nr:ATP-grasp domain-containing protein [Clostridia bacterium]